MATDTGTKDSTTDTASKGTAAQLTDAAQPYLDKAKGFAKARPFAAAAVAGVLGVALLNTLRGKGRNA